METQTEKYESIVEEIEKIAVTLSLTSDPEVKHSLRRIMRLKIQQALDTKSNKE